MPRTLKDLSKDERKALLNAVWTRMVEEEIASPEGTNEPIESPIGKTGPLPSDLSTILRPGRIGAGGEASWGIINGGGCGKAIQDLFEGRIQPDLQR